MEVTARRAKAVEGTAETGPDPAPGGVSSPDMIVRDIVQGLYEGRFVPGQRLVEADLTRGYGVGRGSVREALNRLAANGIVALNRHRGAHIRALTRAAVGDILALLEVLIGLAARLAAERIGNSDRRAALDASFERLMSFETRPDSFELVRARDRFYASLVEVGGNAELARILPGMQVHLVRVQFRAYSTEAEKERFEDYRAIGEAVLAGDAPRAEAAGRRHIRRLALALERLPDGAFASG